jgi:hypothetical protein
MADATLPLDELTNALAGLTAAQLQERLDRLASDEATIRALLRVTRLRERRERRLRIPERKGAGRA